jgi:signal transduction histidine kinase
VISRSPIVRLVALYCLLLLVLGASFALFTVRSFERSTSETILREIAARSLEIWHSAKSSLDVPSQLAQLMEQRFAPEAQERFIRISERGRVLYQSQAPTGTDMPELVSQLSRSAEAFSGARFGPLYLDRQTYIVGKRQITVDSGQSDRFASGIEHDLTRALLLGMPLLLMLAAMGGYLLMRSSLRPLERMIDAAEAITFNNPEMRLPLANTGDRLETLGLALNRMLDRLDSAYQHANRFSVDAAHELRTPLAIVRGELEFVAKHKRDPAMDDALKTVTDEVIRMSEMVDNLGMMSHMESLWGKQAHAEFDLFALARETMDQMQLLAQEKHVEFLPLAGSATLIAGDRSRLKQLIVNLLDNAIKYTPEGGRVSVEVRPHGHRAELVVSDTGIGIAPEHQKFVFDRFYRVSADRGLSGSGLGLSIVQAICSAHGGKVSVVSTGGDGSSFRVELPLSNAILAS